MKHKYEASWTKMPESYLENIELWKSILGDPFLLSIAMLSPLLYYVDMWLLGLQNTISHINEPIFCLLLG